jgi:hypothetical protein
MTLPFLTRVFVLCLTFICPSSVFSSIYFGGATTNKKQQERYVNTKNIACDDQCCNKRRKQPPKRSSRLVPSDFFVLVSIFVSHSLTDREELGIHFSLLHLALGGIDRSEKSHR